MNAGEYLRWYYLIYLLPGGVSLLLLLLSALGGGHHHHRLGGHGHHPVSGHHPAGGPRAVGHPAHHAAGKSAAPGHPVSARPSPAKQALAFFGGGRVPGPLVWGSLLLGWGVFGFWATRLIEPSLRFPALFAPLALGPALLGALGTARGLAGLWTRLLPPEESFATGTVDLCGLTGQVAYAVNEARGRVHVYDAHGTLHDVSARVAPGRPAVVRGRRVLVTDFNAARGFVVVKELP